MTDEAQDGYTDSDGRYYAPKTINYPLAAHNLIDMTKGDCAWLKLNPENIQASQTAAMKEFAKFDWREKDRSTGVIVIDRNLKVLIDECRCFGNAFSNMTLSAMKMRKVGYPKTETLESVFEGQDRETSLSKALIDYVFDADLKDAEVMAKADYFAQNLATEQFKAAVARQLAKCNPI